MTGADHTLSVGFGRDQFFSLTADIVSYQITNDMLALADSWSIELPVKRQLWDLVETDNEVQVHIDNSLVLSGFVGRRAKNRGRIEVSGRDRGGRLVDESAPLVRFAGKKIEDLALAVAGEWFEEVRLDNATNRRLIGGRGARRRANVDPEAVALAIATFGGSPVIPPSPPRRSGRTASGEPAILVGKEIRHKVAPGETRAEVLMSFLEQAGLMAWSTADGKTLVVGKPNQRQPARWHFFQAAPGSTRRGETNVIEMEYIEDVEELFAEITACGAGKGDSVNYGKNVTRRRATARLAGRLFARAKRLLISDPDVRSPAEALERAEREMRELAAGSKLLEIEVSGHGQFDPRVGWPEIFRFDTVAHVEDEEIGLVGDFFVTRCEFSGSKRESRTMLSLVPVGTELRCSG
jgi:prophage tail gpP-like protein